MGIKHLTDPGPSDAELRTLVAAALRGPDHGELVPWRLVAVRGAARERLAELFVRHAQLKGKDAEGVAIERERALKAPLIVAVVARIDLGHPQVPAHEQWMCVGGAVTNFLNAVHALGYAAKMLSGDKARATHHASLLRGGRDACRLDLRRYPHAGLEHRQPKGHRSGAAALA